LTVENIEILIKCIPKPEVARHNLETKHSNNNFDIRVSLLFFFFFFFPKSHFAATYPPKISFSISLMSRT
jgi:hypothetical protein